MPRKTDEKDNVGMCGHGLKSPHLLMESGDVVLLVQWLVQPSALHMCSDRRPRSEAGSLPSGFKCLSWCVFIVRAEVKVHGCNFSLN